MNYTINELLRQLAEICAQRDEAQAEVERLRADLREAVAVLQVFGFCIEPDEMEWVARRDALLTKHQKTDQ